MPRGSRADRSPVAVILLTLLAVACGTGGGSPGNALQPQPWMQLQGNEQGTGFNAVHTTLASPGYREWAVNVGEMAFSSPVIDRQGNI